MAASKFEIPGQILVRGVTTNLANLKDYPEIISELTESLQEVLKLFGIQTLAPLQERILFAIESGLDLYVAGPRNGGKRTAYLLLVMAHVLQQHFACKVTEEERRAAPSAIIFCESTAKGLFIKSMLQNVLDNFATKYSKITASSIPNVVFVDNVHHESSESFLKEPLDILIITGSALQELLNRRVFTRLDMFCLNYERVRYIIFEELGMKNFFFEKEVTQFLYEVSDKPSGQSVLQKVAQNVQLIFSGTVWQSGNIGYIRGKLFRELERKSVMIFGSALQALQYSKSTTWTINHVNGDKAKLNMLIGICKSRLAEERTIVIACSTSDLAMTVSQYISKHGGICNKVITLGRNGATIGVFKSFGLNTVYVIADEALPDFTFHDASCLIHFDIDLQLNKRNEDEPFCQQRFSCLWMRLQRVWRSSAEPHGVTHLLVTGKEPNFLALYKFLQSADIPLPHSLQEIAEQRLKTDLSKPLCSNLKCFAYCNSILDCPDRHEFSQEDLDTPPDAPKSGELEFKVIKSCNPSLYVGKLLNHYVFNENGERACVKVYKDEVRERINQMMDYYSNERNRIYPMKISMDELFCVPFVRKPLERDQQQCNVLPTLYFRAKPMKFVYFDGFAHNAPVTHRLSAEHLEMFCVDIGTTMIISTAKLMILPDRFRKWKPHCVQIVLSNMLFHDETREYHSDALEAAKRLTEGKNWNGKILLSLRDTVWINSMVQYEKDPGTGHVSLGCNLFTELFNGKYVWCVDSHNHMMVLLEYIRKQDPNYPGFEQEMTKPSTTSHSVSSELSDYQKVWDPNQWKSIPQSNLESGDNQKRTLFPVSFKISVWSSPWEIYGTICENEGLSSLTQLEVELTREIETKLANQNNVLFSKVANVWEAESVVAVRVGKERKWQRGLIQKNADELSSSGLNIFLVDSGFMIFGMKEMEQVVPIPTKYVESLPFQVICLKLAHIQPMNRETDWQERNISALSAIINFNHKITTVAFSKVQGTYHPCNYYQAMVYQNLEEKAEDGYPIIELGAQLVMQNCAEYTSTALMNQIIDLANCMKDAQKGNRQTSSDDLLVEESEDEEDDADSETSMDRWNRFRDVEIENDGYIVVGQSEACSEGCDEIAGDKVNIEETEEAIESIFNMTLQKSAEKFHAEPEGELVCENSNHQVLVSSSNELDPEAEESDENEFFDATKYELEEFHAEKPNLECYYSPVEVSRLGGFYSWFVEKYLQRM